MSQFLFSEIFATPGSQTIYPPPGATQALFRCIGGGGGADVWASPISPKSGGGGAYAATILGGAIGLQTVSPGVGIPAHVGAGGPGGNYIYYFPGEDTWVGSSNYLSGSCLCLANGSNFPDGRGPGYDTLSKGDVKNRGGTGLLNILSNGPGAPGAGAGGPNGAGTTGTCTPDGSYAAGYGNGGNGDAGFGGAGGIWVQPNLGQNPPAQPGANGQEISVTIFDGSTVKLGAGGGGASANPTAAFFGYVGNGGAGGLYGGGGGIGNAAINGNSYGGAGAQGVIIVDWYGTLPTYTYRIPACVGAGYISQGQILRPAAPPEAGTQTGPAQGKKRRIVTAAPLLFSAQGVQQGVDFLKMRAVPLLTSGGTQPIGASQLFSGVAWQTIDADYNYDNMWCWQVTRPFPCTVVSVECQLETQENN